MYLMGNCHRGNDCPNKHSVEKTIVCKHWLRGLCKKNERKLILVVNAEVCEFLHEYNLKKMPECWFFTKNGECSNPECLYRHIDPNSKIRWHSLSLIPGTAIGTTEGSANTARNAKTNTTAASLVHFTWPASVPKAQTVKKATRNSRFPPRPWYGTITKQMCWSITWSSRVYIRRRRTMALDLVKHIMSGISYSGRGALLQVWRKGSFR